jgi:hypothetical protein
MASSKLLEGVKFIPFKYIEIPEIKNGDKTYYPPRIEPPEHLFNPEEHSSLLKVPIATFSQQLELTFN